MDSPTPTDHRVPFNVSGTCVTIAESHIQKYPYSYLADLAATSTWDDMAYISLTLHGFDIILNFLTNGVLECGDNDPAYVREAFNDMGIPFPADQLPGAQENHFKALYDRDSAARWQQEINSVPSGYDPYVDRTLEQIKKRRLVQSPASAISPSTTGSDASGSGLPSYSDATGLLDSFNQVYGGGAKKSPPLSKRSIAGLPSELWNAIQSEGAGRPYDAAVVLVPSTATDTRNSWDQPSQRSYFVAGKTDPVASVSMDQALPEGEEMRALLLDMETELAEAYGGLGLPKDNVYRMLGQGKLSVVMGIEPVSVREVTAMGLYENSTVELPVVRVRARE